jgi:hypothetical protein
MAQVSGERGCHVSVKEGTTGDATSILGPETTVEARAPNLLGMWDVNSVLSARFWSIAARERWNDSGCI